MSKELTLITEIGTGLGMIPDLRLADVFDGRVPDQFVGVDTATWETLRTCWDERRHLEAFADAFDDGRYFLESDLGLRRRAPLRIEWKGPHRAPEDDPLPADLRIDSVFVVSCKNLSKALLNPSPAALFGSALRNPDLRGPDWYEEIAPVELADLYGACVRHLGLSGFPTSPSQLKGEERVALKKRLARTWPDAVAPEVAAFVRAVSTRSADLLDATLATRRDRERFYWRLLRLHSAPYFILGRQPSGPTRLQVMTPWDLRRRFEFTGLEVSPASAGQPQIQWQASFTDVESGEPRRTRGHIEIRWSHGRFRGAPESKIYLDTPHEMACGYLPI